MDTCLAAARAQGDGIATKLIELAGMDIRPCQACGKCKGQLECSIQDDFASLVPILSNPAVSGMINGAENGVEDDDFGL